MSLAHAGRHLMAALLVVSLALTGLVAVGEPAAAATLSTEERRASDLIAASRRSAGVPALRVCADLVDVAQRWSRRMASTGTLAHNPKARDEISGWRAWGENVGVGSSVDVVHQAFVKSSGHRANLLSSSFTHVGVGVAQGGGRTWVTQVFRTPKSGQACNAVTTPLPEWISRVQGADRYGTAAALSRSAHDRAATVIVASAEKFPDALAAAPLSAKLGAPILLTGGDGLRSTTKQEIQRLGAKNAVVLGSTATLSSRIDRDLKGLGLSVRRIAGAHRYATAAAIAREVGGTRIVVARGDRAGWADAIAASGYAAHRGLPVLLVDGRSFDASAWAEVRGLGVRTVDIVGGTAAVGTAIEQRLEDAGISTRRLAGADRLATSAKVADASVSSGMSAGRVWLATSRNWSDALAAGPAVARKGGVLLLADPRGVDTRQATAAWLSAQGSTVRDVVLVGGPAAIADRVGHDVAKLVR